MIKDSESIPVHVTLLHVTKLAYLIDPVGSESPQELEENQMWIPRSQCNDIYDKYDIGKTVELEIAVWLAKERDII